MQNVVEYAAGVQLARCLEENVEHLQVGAGAGGRLPGRKLAEELLRRAGGRAVGAEQHVRPTLHAELDVIVAVQLAAVDALAVDERPMAAGLVDDVDAVDFSDELSVFARDARIGHHQVAIGAAANGERKVIEHDGATVGSFHHHQHLRIAGGGGIGLARPHSSCAHQACLLRGPQRSADRSCMLNA